jgi:plastocyanin
MSVTVTTDKSSYFDTETIKISGMVDEILERVPISLQIISSDGNLMNIAQIVVGSDKKFSTELTAGGSLWNSDGSYTIKIIYGSESTETTFDYTMPHVDSYDLIINSTNPRMVDAFGNPLEEISLGQQVQISSDLTNTVDREQIFAYLVQIQDENGVTVSLAWITGSMASKQSFSPALSWMPTQTGSYEATIFVWRSVDEPIPLSNTISITIDVGIKTSTLNTISIPAGSSVPGCEEKHECFIPYKTKVTVGNEIVWHNDDTAAHTITSGIPSDGPDGVFDSGMIMSKNTFSHRFEKAGRYPYFCMLHPWQIGEVIIEDQIK